MKGMIAQSYREEKVCVYRLDGDVYSCRHICGEYHNINGIYGIVVRILGRACEECRWPLALLRYVITSHIPRCCISTTFFNTIPLAHVYIELTIACEDTAKK